MSTVLKSWFASVVTAFDTLLFYSEFSRFNDARLRDIGIDPASIGSRGGDVPWQAAEQGGTGAKVHLHIGMAA